MKNPFAQFDFRALRRLLRWLGKEKPGYIARILLFCAAEAIGPPIVALSTRMAVNSFASGGWENFALACAWKLSSHVLWMLAAPVERRSSISRAKRTLARKKREAAAATLRADQRALDALSQGELLAALSTEADKAESLLSDGVFEIARSAIGGAVGFALMAYMDWRFTLIVLALSALSVWASALFGARIRAAGEKTASASANTGADALELLRAAEAVRLAGAEDARYERFVESARAEAEARRQSEGIAAKMRLLEGILGGVSWFAVLLGGMILIEKGLTDIGTVAAMLGLRYVADILIVECGQHLAVMQGNLVGFRRLEAVDALLAEKPDADIGRCPDEYSLCVSNVAFSYTPGVPVLRSFHMELPKTGLTLLSGRSGSGKSTLVKLLLGLYRPDAGEIALTGGCADIAALRERVAYAPQKPTLLRGTIFENIAVGKEGATREQALSAARAAGLSDTLSKLPDGIDTELDDAGGSLSGGEKQRVAIARALVKDAPILLLDEITSALDAQAERAVLETVKALSRDRAVLLVSHRPLSEAYADRIVRMEPALSDAQERT